jgi:hypothetical protein
MLRNFEVTVVRLANGTIDVGATLLAATEKLEYTATIEKEVEAAVNGFLTENKGFKSGNLDGVAAGCVDVIESTTQKKIPFMQKPKVALAIKEAIRADRERFYCRSGKGRSKIGGVVYLPNCTSAELAAVEADKAATEARRLAREAAGESDE